MTTLGLVLVLAAAQQDPPYIFGLHEPGGENHMAEMGRKGWIVFTEEVGRDPADLGGKDFSPWSSQGYGVIVRINHGYGPSQGTLPYAKHYDAFAQRAANYVKASKGAHLWQIANETNHPQEWPRYEGTEERITAAMYVTCFRKCRDLIKALPGHAGDQVIPQPTAPWAAVVGQGWIEYHREMLDRIGEGGLDGISIHTYTHGADPNLVFSESKMNPPYQDRYYNFRAYRDFMNAIPAWARALPVYVTECSQNGPWADTNSGWVRNAYREINDWNTAAGTQKIRALCLYRWPNHDASYIVGKNGVIGDFRDAMRNDYRWTSASAPGLPDAIVTALSYSNGVFRATVKNAGAAATPSGVSIGVAYFVDGAYRTWGTIPGPLAAGASASVGTNGGSFTIPDGPHTILARVDDVNRFAESNEGNNELSQTITVGGPALPDVVVTALSYSNGLFTSTVKNQGTAATPAGTAVGVAYHVDGVYRTWGSVAGPLAAGASITIGTQGGSFFIGPGTHPIAARVDDVNRFAESNENNNLYSASVTINASLAAEAVVPAEAGAGAEAPPAEGGSGGSCGALGAELFFLFLLRLRRRRG